MMKINAQLIGQGHSPYIVAEMSANHNGSIKNAFKIIDVAKRAGANAIKMQTYTPYTITLNSSKPDFFIYEGPWAGNNLFDLYSQAYTPWEWHRELFNYAASQRISLFSTPFDTKAVEFLETLNSPAYKIASFECIDTTLIRVAASTGKPLIISTGMATSAEIGEAVDTALRYGNGELVLLHCISAYPAAPKDYNLATLEDMRTRFGVEVGLSDHTLDNTTAIAAVALGAVMIEKHVTLDRKGGGPDDSFSLQEKELTELCSTTHTAWQSLGRVNYERTEAEKGNLKFRRSLYFVRSLEVGDIITSNDIRSVRPGYGLSPKFFDYLLGKKVICSVEENSPVTSDVVEGFDL